MHIAVAAAGGLWLLCALLAALVARRRGYEPLLFLIGGLFSGPFALQAALTARNYRPDYDLPEDFDGTRAAFDVPEEWASRPAAADAAGPAPGSEDDFEFNFPASRPEAGIPPAPARPPAPAPGPPAFDVPAPQGARPPAPAAPLPAPEPAAAEAQEPEAGEQLQPWATRAGGGHQPQAMTVAELATLRPARRGRGDAGPAAPEAPAEAIPAAAEAAPAEAAPVPAAAEAAPAVPVAPESPTVIHCPACDRPSYADWHGLCPDCATPLLTA